MAPAKTILVVDDEEQIAALLERQLKDAGYRVLTAPDPFSGLGQALTHQPDLVVMDICFSTAVMGFSVAERMRGSGLGATPIVFITGKTEPRFQEEAESLGAAGFFQKPYDADRLIATISETLSPPPPSPSGVAALSLA